MEGRLIWQNGTCCLLSADIPSPRSPFNHSHGHLSISRRHRSARRLLIRNLDRSKSHPSASSSSGPCYRAVKTGPLLGMFGIAGPDFCLFFSDELKRTPGGVKKPRTSIFHGPGGGSRGCTRTGENLHSGRRLVWTCYVLLYHRSRSLVYLDRSGDSACQNLAPYTIYHHHHVMHHPSLLSLSVRP